MGTAGNIDIAGMLVQYLDTGVDGLEIRQLCRAAVAQRIRDIKLASAQAVVQARSCDLMNDPGGSNAAHEQARRLQRQYHDFYAQWLVLEGPAVGGPGQDPQRPGLRNDEVSPAAPAGAVEEGRQ